MYTHKSLMKARREGALLYPNSQEAEAEESKSEANLNYTARACL